MSERASNPRPGAVWRRRCVPRRPFLMELKRCTTLSVKTRISRLGGRDEKIPRHLHRRARFARSSACSRRGDPIETDLYRSRPSSRRPRMDGDTARVSPEHRSYGGVPRRGVPRSTPRASTRKPRMARSSRLPSGCRSCLATRRSRAVCDCARTAANCLPKPRPIGATRPLRVSGAGTIESV